MNGADINRAQSGLAGGSGATRLTTACAALTELLLVALLAVLVARGVWFLAYGSDVDPLRITGSITGSRPVAADRPLVDLSSLTRGDLFAGRSFAGTQETPDSLPETQLNLTLHGVRRGDTPDSGSAVIQSTETGQRTVPVGGEVVPGVVLQSVYADRVIIDRRGVRESLFLRDEATRRRQSVFAGDEPRSTTGPSRPDAAPNEAVRSLTALDWVQGLQLSRIEARTGLNPAGYRIGPGSEPGLLTQAGLEVDDIVTAVNGRSLARALNTLDLLEELGDARSAVFVVQRAGEARTIEVTLR